MTTKKTGRKAKRVKKIAESAQCMANLGAAVAGAAKAIEPLSKNERICVLAALVELFDAGMLDRPSTFTRR